MHNEEAVIDQFFRRVLPIADGVGNYEVICVDDGSTDKTWSILKGFAATNPRIKLVKFSRNFGKESALTAGLDYATGDAVIPIDSDLQDPPELIPEMVKKWREGFKVVLATRKSRDESWLKKNSAMAFYKLFSKFATIKIPRNTGDYRLMDKEVVEAVKSMRERTRFMKGIFSWPGFNTYTLYFDRPERAAGETKWNYWKLFKFGMDGIFSFTTLPLRVWTFIGSFISLFAFLYGVLLMLKTLIYGAAVPGYASIMVVMLFLGGIQLLSLGIIGEYVGRIYRETKNRPIYVVEEAINAQK